MTKIVIPKQWHNQTIGAALKTRHSLLSMECVRTLDGSTWKQKLAKCIEFYFVKVQLLSKYLIWQHWSKLYNLRIEWDIHQLEL